MVERRALDRGKKLLAKPDYARALLQFKNAIQAMPQEAEPYYEAGLAALGEQDAVAAFEYFNRAAELDPNHTDARVKAAELMATSSDLTQVAEAEKLLTGLLPASASNLELLDSLGLAERQLNKPGEAARYLRQALEKAPGHLASSIALARVKLSQKDPAGAEDVLKRAVEQDSQAAAPRLALAGFYLQVKRTAEAEAQIRRVIDIDPQNGPALLGLATIQAQTGRVAKAEQSYRRLSALPDEQYKPLHAMFLLETGNAETAIPELERLAKTDAGRDSRSLLVAAYVSTGRIDQARKVLSTALRANPKDGDALLQKCQLDLQMGEPAAAVEVELHQVLLFRPDSAQAHLALARVYALEGSKSMRRQELGEALRLSPRLAAARSELVEELIGERQPDAALEVVRQTPEDQQELLPMLVSRIWALEASGDAAGARRQLDERLAAGRLPDLVFLDAVLRLGSRDYAGAELAAEEVLRQRPGDLRVLRLLLDCYSARNKNAEAENVLRTAAAQQPKSAPLECLVGEWRMRHGDNAGARAALLAAKAADPQFTDAALQLADLDVSEGRLDAARENLLALVSSNAGSTAAYLRLAALEDRAGNSAGAIAYLRKVVDLDGANALALNNLSFLLAKTDADEALVYANRAEQLAPQNPAVEDTLGWIYYRKRMYNAAIGHLKIAVAKGPSARRQLHLGMAYSRSGDPALGQTIIAAALKSDPTLAASERDW
ncbi:MAG TPA: tetratricopeptide repeat protein [Bryobacteraceae bacterium]|nr:tetratricopeptide repeat protein [Bryobacteraceae bacterium]